MAENKKGFVLYADLIHTIEKLPSDKAGDLFKHILRYVNDLNPLTDDMIVDLVFEPIKQQLKRDLVKWEEFRIKQSENGKLGGRPKKDMPLILNPKNPSLILESQKSLKVTVTDTVKDKVIVKDIKKNTYTPPTLELVKLYFIENGYSETSANKAYEYYNSANWHDSNGKQVKNWKQKMQGVWFKDENKTTIAPTVKIKVPEDFYTQSEYEEYCKKNNLVSQWKPMVW
jgi:hypothetical protein